MNLNERKKKSIFHFVSGEKRTSTESAIIYELVARSRISLERGHPHQGLPARGLRHQVYGGHVGVLEDGERGGQIRGLHSRLDETDPRAFAGE